MKPAPFDYYAPTTIEEVCTLLAAASGGATVLTVEAHTLSGKAKLGMFGTAKVSGERM